MEALKAKIKLWWYQATDHRHQHTFLELMALPVVLAVFLAVKELLGERPKLLLFVLATLGTCCLAFFAYCLVGEVLFHLRVRKEQGKTKTHDLQ